MWGAVQTATRTRVSTQRVNAGNASWVKWQVFCASISVDPFHLPADAIPILQIFAQRLRSGTLNPRGKSVRSRTVEDALRAVGQAYAGMGALDPRMNSCGKPDFRLTSLYQAWSKADDPPSRVKPLPTTLMTQTVALAKLENTEEGRAIADILPLGVFFLLRPGKYMGTPSHVSDDLFRLQDLRLWVGNRALDHLTCPVADLQASTFASLTFTRQKNGVRNETIGHGRSGDPQICPVLCLVQRVLALRALHATPTTPINAYGPAPLRYVQSRDVTRRIRTALAIHPHPGYTSNDISARSTRAGGAMALLCAGVNRDRIRMIGRWRSDEMFRYLHVQAQPVMTGVAAAMLRGGSYHLAPG
jgi:hypothetical protein